MAPPHMQEKNYYSAGNCVLIAMDDELVAFARREAQKDILKERCSRANESSSDMNEPQDCSDSMD